MDTATDVINEDEEVDETRREAIHFGDMSTIATRRDEKNTATGEDLMLEYGGQIDVICTAFGKAFDMVPHNRLISKLYSFNINEYIIEWIKAYLENRVQRVRINSCFSNWANVVSGIHQGSILGPLLFII